MVRQKRSSSVYVSSAELSPLRKRLPREAKSGSPSRPSLGILAQKKALEKAAKAADVAPRKRGRPKLAQSSEIQPEVYPRDDHKALVRAFAASTHAKSPTVSEADIYAAPTSAKLAELVNRLVSTEQETLFQQLHEKSAQQQAQDGTTIAEILQKLESRQVTIDTLTLHVQSLQQKLAEAEEKLRELEETSVGSNTPQKLRTGKQMYELPIRRKPSDRKVHSSDIDDELKTIAFTFDMLELLTGVRIISYQVDEDRFLFDVKQTNTVQELELDVINIEYQLIIQRDFEQAAEVTYVPVFLELLERRARDAEQEAKNKDAARVQAHLPAYLQQSLTFPYNTLLQFYTKLSKALNKSIKG